MNRDELAAFLDHLQACPEGAGWAKAAAKTDPTTGHVDMRKLWEDCTQADWMLWYLEILFMNKLHLRLAFIRKLLCGYLQKVHGPDLGFSAPQAAAYLEEYVQWLDTNPLTVKDIPRLPDWLELDREIEKYIEDDYKEEQLTACWGLLCFLYGYAINGNDPDPEDDMDLAVAYFDNHFAGEIVNFDWWASRNPSPMDGSDVRTMYPEFLYMDAAHAGQDHETGT